MKIFACKTDLSYSGGLIIVAAKDKQEVFLTAASDKRYEYMFHWHTDDGYWSEPDSNIEHCDSDVYPFDKWFEIPGLYTVGTEPEVIIEDSYCE